MPDASSQAKTERLKAALRENLKRRKAQARGRTAIPEVHPSEVQAPGRNAAPEADPGGVRGCDATPEPEPGEAVEPGGKPERRSE